MIKSLNSTVYDQKTKYKFYVIETHQSSLSAHTALVLSVTCSLKSWAF